MPVGPAAYPVNLLLAGKRCLVVGGGAVAAEKVRGLLEVGAVVHVVATEVGPEVRALAGPDLSWEERPYRSGDVGGHWWVVTATGDPDLGARVLADAEAEHVFCNAADDPGHCTATLPSRFRRGDLVVAVSTGGHAPAVAAWLRRQLEAEVGPEYGTAVALVAELRAELVAAGRSTIGLDWRSALDGGMLEAIREGHLAEAKERLQACLSSPSD